MGTYIYSCAEVKNPATGEWEQVGEVFPVCSSYKPFIGEYTDAPFYWQCYDLFCFLADVRNQAGCPVITPLRGLPKDWLVEEEYSDCCLYGDPNQWVRGILEDYHSHHWLLLSELLEFDYEYVFESQTELNEGFEGNTTEHQSNTWLQLLEILDPNRQPKSNIIVLKKTGKFISFREHIGHQFFKTLNILKTLGEPNNVRVVFWFD